MDTVDNVAIAVLPHENLQSVDRATRMGGVKGNKEKTM